MYESPRSVEVLPNSPKIVITGATGWVGRALVSHLLQGQARVEPSQIHLWGSKPSRMRAPDGSQLTVGALADLTPDTIAGALVIHLSFITLDRVAQFSPAAFLAANETIDQYVLDAVGKAPPAGVFVASSGAASVTDHHASSQGCSPYTMAKLRQEELFGKWFAKTECPGAIARIYSLSGPYTNKPSTFALESFIRQALQESLITIKSRVPVYRSYLHVNDLCQMILSLVRRQRPSPDQPIDLCGTPPVEIGDLARAIADCIGGGVTIRRGSVDWGSPQHYVGDAREAMSIATQEGFRMADLNDQVADTVAWIRRENGLKQPARTPH